MFVSLLKITKSVLGNKLQLKNNVFKCFFACQQSIVFFMAINNNINWQLNPLDFLSETDFILSTNFLQKHIKYVIKKQYTFWKKNTCGNYIVSTK